MQPVVIVGAGAAGLIAAWRAAECGAKVILLEKTARIGTKILISGGGKCNITHAGSIESVLKAFRANEARFIRPACYRFTNEDVVKLLTDRGLTVYTRPDGRIFPVDQTSKDVVAILGRMLQEAGVELRLDCPVRSIESDGEKVTGVMTDKGLIAASQVILAVGGSSYPNSGTTGDGWPWAKTLGHSIVKVRAALAPMYIELEQHKPAWSGIALRDCLLKVRLKPAEGKAKEIERWRGDLLFTHQGISGPCALGVSRVVAENAAMGSSDLYVDLVPDLTPEQVVERAQAYAKDHPRRLVASWVHEFLPDRLVDDLVLDAAVDPTTTMAQLDKKGRNRLMEVMKAWSIGRVRAVPLEKGEVVAGGVSLDEVDPKTMRSSKILGLYLCGEVLDVAGPVGGYNLQAAFATGYVAGETAAHDALGSS